ncbi:peptidoglycan DD-metalloendopeptidase family protein [Evansella sp. LMS18]|uniref:murein hydrolase activator EnvC family protein n=1 Tax=Evansella sp. LMS18 TaxID=2924033 RepID=UPI0020D1863F|nr:M23 family metallopeptidase [Evansella sp. LMS18]UTR11731.1 peptidoglycan DD-metalloendopeptidase family protein [Evansella sp. LMS18]
MYQKLLLVSLAVLLSVTGIFHAPEAEANTGSDLEKKIDSYQEKQEEIEAESKQKEEELGEVETEIEEAKSEIRRIDENTAQTNENIREKEDEIESTNKRIETLHEEIKELEERIAERDELLKDRVRSMYQNGGTVNYLEVILGAQSIGDLIERVSALTTITNQDRNILEQHIEDKQAVERAKEQLEQELINLEEQMAELETLLAELEEQRQEKDELMAMLEDKQVELETEMVSLDEEQELLKVQEEAAKEELRLWEEEQKRLEEEKRKQEEERKKAEEERKRKESETQVSSSGSSGSSGGNASAAPADSGSGTLMRPATGRITSNFGPRWGRMHYGMDIGQGGRSNVPIVAAEAGTVIEARYMNGYGNTIMISHVVNGRQLTTLYAHLDSMAVSSGQRVSRGQQIGIMGNTGQSTGPHLHFEVHEGGWNGAKSNAVDPRKYLD